MIPLYGGASGWGRRGLTRLRRGSTPGFETSSYCDLLSTLEAPFAYFATSGIEKSWNSRMRASPVLAMMLRRTRWAVMGRKWSIFSWPMA
jgi:hypothetical protein